MTAAARSSPGGSFELTAAATDGSTGTPADERSGVRELEILLDGESVEYAQQACPQGSCPLSRSWRFDSAEHPGGDHVVEVVVRDHLGQSSSERFEFTSGPCCTGPATLWGSATGQGALLFGDVNGDGRSDAIGRDTLSREMEVALSNGSGFDSFRSWGRLLEFETAADLRLGDVDFDGLDDLVGRDPLTQAVLVAISTGESFAQPTPWGMWPSTRSFDVGDIDGDRAADLVGRDRDTGQVHVAYSTDTAFGPSAPATPGFGIAENWDLVDVDDDLDDDLVIHEGDSLKVALSGEGDTFGAPTVWGNLPAGSQALLGDVDGDHRGDVLGSDPASGALTLLTSTGSSFAPARSFGSFPTGHALTAIEADGNGQFDIVGHQQLTGSLRLALTRMAVPVGPAAGSWEPAEDVDYELSDPADSGAVQAQASGGLGSEIEPIRPIRLGFQDERRINRRVQLPGVNDDRNAFDSEESQANASLDAIYQPMQQLFDADDPPPIMRFIVYWGQIEQSDGSYKFAKLDKAVNQAIAKGFRPYLTLTGDAKLAERGEPDPRECSRVYAGGASRACVTGPTGRNPEPRDYGDFVEATARHFGERVPAYGIWNEPNNPTFLQALDPVRHQVDRRADTVPLYRSLYREARERIRRVDPQKRVFIGELSHLTRPCARRVTARCQHKAYNALQYLQALVGFNGPTAQPLLTDGVAWHPYQHVGTPSQDRRVNGVVGINSADDIQLKIDDLWRTQANGERLLRTGGGRRPPLYFTEFGYFNGPYPAGARNLDCKNCGDKYYKTEADKASLIRRSLTRAENEGALWMVLYQATEISPEDYRGGDPEPDPDRPYQPEYGLFSPGGQVNGTRNYGKGPGPVAANDQRRAAFCAVFDWVALRKEYVGSPPKSPCAS